MKQDEIREIPQEDGKNNLFVKKYDIWWPAYKNDKGEVFPFLDATGDGYDSIHDNLKNMLIALEKSGEKEIDFSHWEFNGVNFKDSKRFGNSILKLMEFADNIDFTGAHFWRCSFEKDEYKNYSTEKIEKGQLKNAYFSEAVFNDAYFGNIDFRNCNFNKTEFDNTLFTHNDFRNCSFYKTNLKGYSSAQNEIKKSTFTACKFDNVQLDYIESTGNRFANCKYKNTDKEKLTSKPSVVGKIIFFKDKIASVQNKSQDVKQKQHQNTDVQR